MSKFDISLTVPRAYGYARVSHEKSLKKGDSLPSQEQRIKNYFDNYLAISEDTEVIWGGCKTESKNISAYRVMFESRPAGRELMSVLRPGDHLIVDKVDRIWRSLEDFIMLVKILREKQIHIHIVEFLGMPIRNDTKMGEFVLRLFVMISELDSQIKSERIKDAIGVVRRKGRRSTCHAPLGCKMVKRTETRNGKPKVVSYLEWSVSERTIMKEIVRLLDEERMLWHDAGPHIEKFIAKVEQREPRSTNDPGYIHALKPNGLWRRYYSYETAYAYLGIRTPAEIPTRDKLLEAARQSRRIRTDRHLKISKKRSQIQKLDPEYILSFKG